MAWRLRGLLAEALSEPIGYELPGLIRLVSLNMLGAALGNNSKSIGLDFSQ
jgi:hypothetical protein